MGFCFNVKVWPPELFAMAADLSDVAYWVQIHNLPREVFSTANVRKIGPKIGESLEIEELMGQSGRNQRFPLMMILFRNVLLEAETPIIVRGRTGVFFGIVVCFTWRRYLLLRMEAGNMEKSDDAMSGLPTLVEQNTVKVLVEIIDGSHKWALPPIRWGKMNINSGFDRVEDSAVTSGILIIVIIIKLLLLPSGLLAPLCSWKFHLFQREAIVAIVKMEMCPAMGWDSHPPSPSCWIVDLQPLLFPCVFFASLETLCIFEFHFYDSLSDAMVFSYPCYLFLAFLSLLFVLNFLFPVAVLCQMYWFLIP
ncbi:hypothetical protein CCACVL1_09148 [Corchorus capsularis]|uniref:Uncharacterized protein n=1 Tax=Corchorus capsularis TaxID=210143 RepID=A0A1R3IXJ8_COCAP|nr:hypothetical protein CCACVL1_09148 [Corchorus capsularis]